MTNTILDFRLFAGGQVVGINTRNIETVELPTDVDEDSSAIRTTITMMSQRQYVVEGSPSEVKKRIASSAPLPASRV